MPLEITTKQEALDAAGADLGRTDWLQITQDRIDRFAEATGDDQWIHVDPERAKDGPFGTTIAHGYLTLALTNLFQPMLFRVPGAKMGVNYGNNKVRFPAPVPVDSRVRMHSEVVEVTDLGEAVQVVLRNTVEIEGHDRPACVAEAIARFTF